MDDHNDQLLRAVGEHIPAFLDGLDNLELPWQRSALFAATMEIDGGNLTYRYAIRLETYQGDPPKEQTRWVSVVVVLIDRCGTPLPQRRILATRQGEKPGNVSESIMLLTSEDRHEDVNRLEGYTFQLVGR